MLGENGFELVDCSFNDMEYTNTYLVCVGVARELVPEYKALDNRPFSTHAGAWIQKYGSEWGKGARRRKIVKSSILQLLGIRSK